MSSWTKKERQIVLELASEKLVQEIIQELVAKGFRKRTPGAVRGIIRRHRKRDKNTQQVHTQAKQDYSASTMSVASQHSNALKEMNELRRNAISKITDYTEKVGNPVNANYKVLSISDTHIPYYHDRHEYKIAIAWLKKLSTLFPKIILTKGNHEERLQSYFQANVDPIVSFMTDPDILQRLADGYDFDEFGNFRKEHNLSNVHYSSGPLSWFTQVGKCIFAHPSGSSSIPMRTAIKTAEYFNARGYDFDSVVIGHTHKMGSMIWNNKLIIEQGCACVPMEYEGTSKMAYRPQAFGYAVMYMDKEGNVDFDKSGPIYYGTGSLTKDKIIEIGE
jgi:predicted phosphodiesterase